MYVTCPFESVSNVSLAVCGLGYCKLGKLHALAMTFLTISVLLFAILKLYLGE